MKEDRSILLENRVAASLNSAAERIAISTWRSRIIKAKKWRDSRALSNCRIGAVFRILRACSKKWVCHIKTFLCYQNLDVTTNGYVVGKIRQVADLSRPVFSIQNAQDQEVLRLVGPVFPCGCCSDVEFDVITSEGVVVGKVSKKWGGMDMIVQEAFTDADNFGVTFPIDLDATVKLSLMGCVFLIVSYFRSCQDFIYTFRISCSSKSPENLQWTGSAAFLKCLVVDRNNQLFYTKNCKIKKVFQIENIVFCVY